MKNLAEKSTATLVKVAMNDAALEHPLLVGAVVAAATVPPAPGAAPEAGPLHLSSEQHLNSHFFLVSPGKVCLQACSSAVLHMA